MGIGKVTCYDMGFGVANDNDRRITMNATLPKPIPIPRYIRFNTPKALFHTVNAIQGVRRIIPIAPAVIPAKEQAVCSKEQNFCS